MQNTITRLMIATAGFAAALCLGAPPSHASGDAPWCAVIDLGTGDSYYDCQYRTVEECVPHVLGGNRGFCNHNPYPSAYAPRTLAYTTHRKRPVHH